MAQGEGVKGAGEYCNGSGCGFGGLARLRLAILLQGPL